MGVSVRFRSKIPMEHGVPWTGLGRAQVSIPRGDGSQCSHAASPSTVLKWAQVALLTPWLLGTAARCFPLFQAQTGLDVLNCPKVGVPEPGATCRRDCGQEPDTDTSHSGSTLGVRKLQRTRT